MIAHSKNIRLVVTLYHFKYWTCRFCWKHGYRMTISSAYTYLIMRIQITSSCLPNSCSSSLYTCACTCDVYVICSVENIEQLACCTWTQLIFYQGKWNTLFKFMHLFPDSYLLSWKSRNRRDLGLQRPWNTRSKLSPIWLERRRPPASDARHFPGLPPREKTEQSGTSEGTQTQFQGGPNKTKICW